LEDTPEGSEIGRRGVAGDGFGKLIGTVTVCEIGRDIDKRQDSRSRVFGS